MGQEAYMEIKKYLSVAISMFEHMENRKYLYTADRCYELILQIEKFLNDKGFVFNKKTLESTLEGKLHLTILNENNKGIVSQVKFFPMEDSDTLETFKRKANEINFIRNYTQPNGELSISLPITDGNSQKYFVEISKGSEYEIINTEINVETGKVTVIQQVLQRFINLEKTGWYAGDLHHHSIYSSPVYGGTDDVVETPQEVSYSMQAVGLTYGALSDHHNIKNHAEWKKTASENFTPIISKEISTSNGHVMALNVPIDVIYDIPRGVYRTEFFLRNEFRRITKQIRSFGGLAQINHPRDPDSAISLNPEFTDMIEIFDTIEIWNGSSPLFGGTSNHDAILLWLDLLEEGRFIPATAGSDTHNTYANDYHEIFNRISWLVNMTKSAFSILPVEFRKDVTHLIDLYDRTAPILKRWVEDSLGSGCVRTYVHLKAREEKTPDAILRALRQGNSFLTNGPILIPTANGKLPGETVNVSTNKVTIDLILISNKPLDYLYIYSNGRKCTSVRLDHTDLKDRKTFDYSQTIRDFDTQGVRWIFFMATSDCTNMAISNPIFLEEDNI